MRRDKLSLRSLCAGAGMVLEYNLCRHLQNALIAAGGACNDTEGGRSERSAGLLEVRFVEDVEDFEAKL